LYQFARGNGKKINPLIVKAVILNSAVKIKDINGSNWSHTTSYPLDTDQGAGFIDALEAYKTLNASGRVYYDTINGAESNYYYVNVTNAPTNLTITIAWNRHATWYWTYDLKNINLKLWNATNSLVNESSSSKDSVEHIHYYVPSNSEYKIEVDPVGSMTEPYAIASSHKMKKGFTKNLVKGYNLISLPVDMDG
jgi:hypothetical protein